MMWKVSLALIVAVQSIAATTYAGDAATLSTAREVAKHGLLAYDAGRFDEAVDKLSKAYAVVHVPTLAVALARALAESGKLVAASELYLEAARIPRDGSWQATQDEAQLDAERERIALLDRIPHLNIAVAGVELSQVAVSIDGVAVPQALADSEQMVDPGERHVEGSYGSQISKRSVLVKEGEHARVVLEFTRADSESSAQSSAPHTLSESAATTPSQMRRGSEDSSPGVRQRTYGWATVVAGGVGLALGAGSGLWAMSKRSSLLDSGRCHTDDVSCRADQAGVVDSYNNMRIVSSVGFIAGGVLTAAGVTLLLTAPKHEARPSAGIWVGPCSAGVHGEF